MPWLQLKLDTSPENAEHIEDTMLAVGALSITLTDNADQPLYEPALGETPLWRQTRITALFDADTDLNKLTDLISNKLCISPKPPIRSEILEDKDWEREWIKNYKPMKFGTRLWVIPSWIEPPEPECTNLLLDPGLAFGTGTHPTTALCLEWLSNQDLKDLFVIDYGCGSGILGIAALLLGAKNALGVDNDPQALIATRENCRRNGLEEDRFNVVYPGNLSCSPADVTVANILAGPLIELAPKIAALTKLQGKLILSGILCSQSEDVMTAYKPWFTLNPVTVNGEWVRIDGVKHSEIGAGNSKENSAL